MEHNKLTNLYYLIENADWSIKWDGYYITKHINKLNKNIIAKTEIRFDHIRDSILHFGSRNIYLPDNFKNIHHSNKVVFTWFHGTPDDLDYIRSLPEGSKRADKIHTSCEISKNQLINWGAEPQKIIQVPIGVDVELFKPYNALIKFLIRKIIGIPKGYKVIGSFQKDGNGWEDGLTPKLIKGPDIFCDVLDQLNKKEKIFVLLSGPARGYVIKRLKKSNVKFKHFYLTNYRKLPFLYNAIDLYLVTSRAEGGPKAITESMACKIPVISTKVGMAPEVIINGENGFCVEIEDVNQLVNKSILLLNDMILNNHFIENGYETVKNYAWNKIANMYYERIYKDLV